MRAIRARYDPFLQTRHRVEQLKQLGHSVDKVEFIVMGGTFMALPEDYRDYFIRNLHDALSGPKLPLAPHILQNLQVLLCSMSGHDFLFGYNVQHYIKPIRTIR